MWIHEAGPGNAVYDLTQQLGINISQHLQLLLSSALLLLCCCPHCCCLPLLLNYALLLLLLLLLPHILQGQLT
jgi:hypothetical protein